jgi:methionyl-tRNA synthetase
VLEEGQVTYQKQFVELKKAKADKAKIDEVLNHLKEGKEKIAALQKEYKSLFPEEEALGKTSKAKPKEKKPEIKKKDKFEGEVETYTLPEELLPGVGVETTNPILPADDKRNILITSSLPYVNNVPHLGNIIGCVLSADVYARYCRLRGHNVLYICGTDEYGTATETKALQEGMTPIEVCNKYFKVHKEIYEWFGCQFDKFGRTTTEQQTKIAQDIFLDIDRNGYLLTQSLEQLYCPSCQKFLADRFVEGTCPKEGCGYNDARGDQCDVCGGLHNPIELINPRCKTCGTTPEPRFSEHLFLDLPRLQGQLDEWVDQSISKGTWSQNSISTTKDKWLKEGLLPRCITRDLKWGTPVPLEKYKDKVFYVWFDAPIGYISITATYTEEWEKWWKNPKNVELYQFMGKDNVPFHCVVFPASLLATGREWTLLNSISTTEYLNYESTQFSKSRGTGVFGDAAKGTGIPAEVWRYYLLVNRPEVSDSDFSWEDFGAKNNNELLANLGNFVNRCLKFVKDRFESAVPALGPLVEDDELLIKEVDEQLAIYVRDMDQMKMKASLQVAMHISRLGNNYLQKQEPWKQSVLVTFKEAWWRQPEGLESSLPVAPPAEGKQGVWGNLIEGTMVRDGNRLPFLRVFCDARRLEGLTEKAIVESTVAFLKRLFPQQQQHSHIDAYLEIKTDVDRGATVLHVGVNLTKLLTAVLEPFIPHFSEKVLRQMQMDHSPIPDRWTFEVPAGHVIRDAVPIFRQIKEQELKEFAIRFAGKQEPKA